MPQPIYILFAGINGVGKSTLYRSGMWEHGSVQTGFLRVNSDEILAEQGGFWQSEADQIRAGKEAVQRVRKYLAGRISFNQETTLAGHSIVRTIQTAHESGYYIVMFYVGVQDLAIANERIQHRTELGGHGINPDVVRRRYISSVSNLLKVLPLCNETYLYDNTVLLNMVARFEFEELAYLDINNPALTWHTSVVEQLGYELLDW